ncbi:MAG: F0F1 ATP synthase subunit gamma [Chloroflexi bacterium]|nr:F0F1 ATP synthase subunit gamma [Chloroflexota bacterium]
MEDIEQVEARLRNIRSITPILSALRTIALGGWRVALARLNAVRAYQEQLTDILYLILPRLSGTRLHGQPTKATVARRGLLVIGSERGLCGLFTTSVVAVAEAELARWRAMGIEGELMVLGERARREFRRRNLFPVWEARLPVTGVPSICLAAELVAKTLPRFNRGELEAVAVAYNHYLGPARYESRVLELLPLVWPHRAVRRPPWPPPIIDTDPYSLYQQITEQLVLIAFFRVLLESAAAEQSARFQLMEGASQNSHRLIDELTLAYHMARQQRITMEMLDLAVGAGLVGQSQTQWSEMSSTDMPADL